MKKLLMLSITASMITQSTEAMLRRFAPIKSFFPATAATAAATIELDTCRWASTKQLVPKGTNKKVVRNHAQQKPFIATSTQDLSTVKNDFDAEQYATNELDFPDELQPSVVSFPNNTMDPGLLETTKKMFPDLPVTTVYLDPEQSAQLTPEIIKMINNEKLQPVVTRLTDGTWSFAFHPASLSTEIEHILAGTCALAGGLGGLMCIALGGIIIFLGTHPYNPTTGKNEADLHDLETVSKGIYIIAGGVGLITIARTCPIVFAGLAAIYLTQPTGR